MNDYMKTAGLRVGYDGKALIRDVALSVQRGKIVTLIGPNGSGKSTILKTVISQLPAIEGAVFLDGEDLRARSRRDTAKRMAIVMTARMDPELMTCRDVVSSGRYPYTGRLGVLREEDKKIVEESLRQVDALDFADKPFQAISDGQRQRILLARALCQQPELIVLDEPTSYLDIRYKLELLSILKRMVREKNLAVLMSLHELDLAARVSDTVVCVAGDRIDKIGAPEEIFTREYIAKLYHMEPGKYDACFDTLFEGGSRVEEQAPFVELMKDHDYNREVTLSVRGMTGRFAIRKYRLTSEEYASRYRDFPLPPADGLSAETLRVLNGTLAPEMSLNLLELDGAYHLTLKLAPFEVLLLCFERL